MEFYEVLERVVDLLQRQGRVSYRALKRQFALDIDGKGIGICCQFTTGRS